MIVICRNTGQRMINAPLQYHHTQRGTLMIGVSLAAAGFVSYYLYHGGPSWLWPLLALLGAVGIIFSRLTVHVDEVHVTAFFAPGWPRLKVPVADISEAKVVRNPWYYGWGVRLTPHGALYNVSGLEAVQIRRKNGKTLRIGTDEPEKLRRALEKVIE